jgi:hypothetical protein
MNDTTNSNGNGKPNGNVKRPRHTVPLAPQTSKEAKRLAAMLLEVLAGLRTPPQAAEALQVSLPRYYQLEARGLRGLLTACEPKPKGRQASPARELAKMQRENQRLQQDLSRQQSLVRMAQRSVGLSPPPAPLPAAKGTGKKTRRRKPVVRALSMAARLREEAKRDAPEPANVDPAPGPLAAHE